MKRQKNKHNLEACLFSGYWTLGEGFGCLCVAFRCAKPSVNQKCKMFQKSSMPSNSLYRTLRENPPLTGEGFLTLVELICCSFVLPTLEDQCRDWTSSFFPLCCYFIFACSFLSNLVYWFVSALMKQSSHEQEI